MKRVVDGGGYDGGKVECGSEVRNNVEHYTLSPSFARLSTETSLAAVGAEASAETEYGPHA